MKLPSEKYTGGLRPWEFAPGSLESRAAARAMLEANEASVERFQIVNCIPSPYWDNSIPHVGAWSKTTDGGLMRVVYIPPDTDKETERRILATP
jgi:hypothetical protein